MSSQEVMPPILFEEQPLSDYERNDVENEQSTLSALGSISVTMAVCIINNTRPCAAPNACALEGFCQYP